MTVNETMLFKNLLYFNKILCLEKKKNREKEKGRKEGKKKERKEDRKEGRIVSFLTLSGAQNNFAKIHTEAWTKDIIHLKGGEERILVKGWDRGQWGLNHDYCVFPEC